MLCSSYLVNQKGKIIIVIVTDRYHTRPWSSSHVFPIVHNYRTSLAVSRTNNPLHVWCTFYGYCRLLPLHCMRVHAIDLADMSGSFVEAWLLPGCMGYDCRRAKKKLRMNESLLFDPPFLYERMFQKERIFVRSRILFASPYLVSVKSRIHRI